MAHVSIKGTIGASASNVWAAISDFNAIDRYLEAITHCTTEGTGVGALRSLTTQDGARIVERLESLDDQSRTLSYTIVESALPLSRYVATMKVKETGDDQCELEWSATFEPKGAPEAELTKMLADLYTLGFKGLNRMHGGGK